MKSILDTMDLLEHSCAEQQWEDVEKYNTQLRQLIGAYFEEKDKLLDGERKAVEKILSRYHVVTNTIADLSKNVREESQNIRRSGKAAVNYMNISQFG